LIFKREAPGICPVCPVVNPALPRTTAAWKTATRTIATPDNYHPDTCHLGQLPPRTIATPDNYHPNNYHPDNYHPDNCHPGKLPPGQLPSAV